MEGKPFFPAYKFCISILSKAMIDKLSTVAYKQICCFLQPSTLVTSYVIAPMDNTACVAQQCVTNKRSPTDDLSSDQAHDFRLIGCNQMIHGSVLNSLLVSVGCSDYLQSVTAETTSKQSFCVSLNKVFKFLN